MIQTNHEQIYRQLALYYGDVSLYNIVNPLILGTSKTLKNFSQIVVRVNFTKLSETLAKLELVKVISRQAFLNARFFNNFLSSAFSRTCNRLNYLFTSVLQNIFLKTVENFQKSSLQSVTVKVTDFTVDIYLEIFRNLSNNCFKQKFNVGISFIFDTISGEFS